MGLPVYELTDYHMTECVEIRRPTSPYIYIVVNAIL